MKPSTLQTKASRLMALDSRRKAHHRALSSLHASPITSYDGYDETEMHEARGLKMWRRLRRIEAIAHDATTAQCNGESYNGQPFREEEAWEDFKSGILAQVGRVFGVSHMHVPAGIYINGDARGMALCLDAEKVKIPDGMATNWGGDGILAADITL